MFASIKKMALSAGLAATLLGGGIAVAHADPIHDGYNINPAASDMAYLYLSETQTTAETTVQNLQYLSATDKAYYVSAIAMATDLTTVYNYLNQAISDNNFNQTHPNHQV